ncbi:mitochondrial import inner membrane translocase subunit Tim21-like [Sinocyclocheilus grahami]|uniref:Mitochondrial import inner membrane translocase subunit Tim21 n=1 Tax=Sinocyclocheilus grahami TaxID=75366 RepID=A0A672T292_SINGR|nr:PREDICTED: mitochondrial import inner membrane translocase subunit Tim21-like [Sinocyclocheilus grahami]
MMYSVFRIGRTTNCVQHLLKRVHVRLPLQISAFYTQPPVFQTNRCPSSKWTFNHTRSLYTGVHFCSKNDGQKDTDQMSVSRSSHTPPPAHKVKQAGKDFTYLIVVLIGLGVTGGLLYVVFQELFSSSSPSKIYGKAFERCRAHPEVIGAFGEPIRGYGETSRRGRRQQVSHVEYMKDGLKYMRLKFYIEGSEPGLRGTVHSESKENPETGKYEFRYIFVEIDTYSRRTIVIEDNR